MKNQRGFAPIIVIVIIILLGVGVYAVVNRDVLKTYFETGDVPTADQQSAGGNASSGGNIPAKENTVSGDKPTASQFNTIIDSAVNRTDATKAPENPVNVVPENKTFYTQVQAGKGVAFRWTPIVPKPQQPVTYRLKVWQLMQGQSGSQAMRTNKPIVTKEVADITEIMASNIYTGPCRPPYLCDFVWNVDALLSGGTLSGSSEPFTFSVVEENTPTGSSRDSSAGSY